MTVKSLLKFWVVLGDFWHLYWRKHDECPLDIFWSIFWTWDASVWIIMNWLSLDRQLGRRSAILKCLCEKTSGIMTEQFVDLARSQWNTAWSLNIVIELFNTKSACCFFSRISLPESSYFECDIINIDSLLNHLCFTWI